MSKKNSFHLLSMKMSEIEKSKKKESPASSNIKPKKDSSSSSQRSDSPVVILEKKGKEKEKKLSKPNADPNIPDRSYGDYYCATCDSHMNSEGMWAAHIIGKRHLKNVKKEDPDTKYEETNEDSSIKHDLRNVKDAIVGLSYIQEVKRNACTPLFTCFLCQSTLPTVAMVIEHVITMKHRLNYIKETSPNDYELLNATKLKKGQLEPLVTELAFKMEDQFGRGSVKVKKEKTKQDQPIRKDFRSDDDVSRSLKRQKYDDRKADWKASDYRGRDNFNETSDYRGRDNLNEVKDCREIIEERRKRAYDSDEDDLYNQRKSIKQSGYDNRSRNYRSPPPVSRESSYPRHSSQRDSRYCSRQSLSPQRDSRYCSRQSLSPQRDSRYGPRQSLSPLRDSRYGPRQSLSPLKDSKFYPRQSLSPLRGSKFYPRQSHSPQRDTQSYSRPSIKIPEKQSVVSSDEAQNAVLKNHVNNSSDTLTPENAALLKGLVNKFLEFPVDLILRLLVEKMRCYQVTDLDTWSQITKLTEQYVILYRQKKPTDVSAILQEILQLKAQSSQQIAPSTHSVSRHSVTTGFTESNQQHSVSNQQQLNLQAKPVYQSPLPSRHQNDTSHQSSAHGNTESPYSNQPNYYLASSSKESNIIPGLNYQINDNYSFSQASSSRDTFIPGLNHTEERKTSQDTYQQQQPIYYNLSTKYPPHF